MQVRGLLNQKDFPFSIKNKKETSTATADPRHFKVEVAD